MKDCTTCKYGYEDERLGIPMCHHPKRFSEDCVDFNMHEEKEIQESEKPMNQDGLEEDLTNEADKMFFSLGFYEGDHHQPMLDAISQEQFRSLARHFAKWSAEHLRK